jgi:serine O-acetyltransferase
MTQHAATTKIVISRRPRLAAAGQRNIFDRIRADLQRVTDQESALLDKVGAMLFSLGFHAVLLYRISHWLSDHHLRPFALIVSYCNSVLTGAQISARANIGKGLVIYHPHGVVIGTDVIIGDYCSLTQGIVIGQHRGGGDRPTIGDYFYAGTGAKIIGNIQIGDHVKVGANAVVLQSLPNHVTAVGVPARIVSRQQLCRFFD